MVTISAIGTRLREAREAAGMTQGEAAAGQKFSRQALSAWERGERPPDAVQLVMLLRRYGISADFVLFGIQTMPLVLARVIERQRERL